MGRKVRKKSNQNHARWEQRGTYIVEILVRESVTFNLSYAIDEQSTRCAHEATCGLLGESLLEFAEEGMGIERWVLVGRGVRRCLDSRRINQGWRAGRRGGRWLVIIRV